MRVGLVIVLLIANAASALAQSGYYQFSIDQDQLSGAPDFSFLNHPLTAEDRLFVRDSHFFRVGKDRQPNTADDERVRLFGLNLAYDANFPYFVEDARRIARRLRRLGVNLVRLHLMDVEYPNSPKGILTTGPYPTFDSYEVPRLRMLLDALKIEGIYATLGLHVAYKFRPEVDGVPTLGGCGGIPTDSKPLHLFHPRMIELQQLYASRLIANLSLANDPVLATVEINNESSLLEAWQTRNQFNDNNLDRYLQGEYRSELQRQWNEFLRAKYGSTAALRAAWGSGAPAGAELLSASGQDTAALRGWHFAPSAAFNAAGEVLTLDGLPTLRIQVFDNNPGVQANFQQSGFSLTANQIYTAEVEIRAGLRNEQCASIDWVVMENGGQYRVVTWNPVSVTNRWQKKLITFRAPFDIPSLGRFSLLVQRMPGTTIYARNWSLRQTAYSMMEDLEQRNVSLVQARDSAPPIRTDDYILFLADRHRAYLRQIESAVRGQLAETVRGLVPVTGTQVAYGGLLNLDSHAEMDYLDNHFYVDHPGFPRGYNSMDWLMADASNVNDGMISFLNMALMSEAGRPYTISEYNQPWPNTYGAEIDPTLAAFAAFQDWDSIMHFAYSHGRYWSPDQWGRELPAGFNLNGDWSKLANIGQSAWLFRTGAIKTGVAPVEIPVSAAARLQATRENRGGWLVNFFRERLSVEPEIALIHPVRLVRDDNASVPEQLGRPLPSSLVADTGETTFDRTGKRFLIHTDKAAGVFGVTGDDTVTAGAMDVQMGASSRKFSATMLTTLDDQPIDSSKRMLLTTPGHLLRSQPGVTPARPQQVVNYENLPNFWTLESGPDFQDASGTWRNQPHGNLYHGIGPTWMERVESFVTIRTRATKIKVYPLGSKGEQLAALGGADVAKIAGGFRIHLQAEGQTFAPWYEIVAEREAPLALPVWHSSGATYLGPELARDSIVAAFSRGLATRTEGATGWPLPTEIAGTSVEVLDSRGIARPAQLFFVSDTQVRYLLPPDAATGEATISVTSGNGKFFAGKALIANVTPGLFAANDSGRGIANGYICRVNPSGAKNCEASYNRDSQTYAVTPRPIDLGAPADKAFLTIYGTGFRYYGSPPAVTLTVGGERLPATEVAADSACPGRDKVTVLLPRALIGRGLVDVVLEVEGRKSNTLQVQIK